ncbi:hypothetical protein ACHAWO_001854 [Cyclotella atomus]|uniref:Uncharacterized protein n=1 Tax=Cyclotella atomus TaxID=382360 RepID=A0ABD3QZF8_9STRA
MGRLLNISVALLINSLAYHEAAAFAPAASHLPRYSSTPSLTSHAHAPKSLLELSAAKRRRRKDAPQPTNTDDLPDFDLDEDVTVESSSTVKKVEQPKPTAAVPSPKAKPSSTSNPTPIKRGSGLSSTLASDLGGNVDGLDEDLILSAMRGQGEAWAPPTSIEDTLRDRSLEKYMNFERQIAVDGASSDVVVDLPTMEEVISRRKKMEAAAAVQEGRIEEAARLIDTEGMGKKAAKKAERKAAAMQREEMEENGGGFSLEGLNVLKLLENGAWLGIGLLVVWEIYINSPFFERAAPLIPAVFD